MQNTETYYSKILDEAHIDFTCILGHKNISAPVNLKYIKQRYLQNSVNADLYFNNEFFNFMDNDYIYLAHITTRKNEILEDKKIMCSSGCLVGSVYCVPAYLEGDGNFRIHNLGKFIFQKEIEYFADTENKKPEILLFKVKRPKNFKYSGINYLKLGKFHLNIYEELKFLLHNDEREEINETILKMVDWSRELLSLLYKYSPTELYERFDKIYPVFERTLKAVPIFGYFNFEIISEFIAYYQNDIKAQYYSNQREIYVGNFKDLVFGVVPNLTNNFDLGQFIPDQEKLKIRFEELGLNYEKYKMFLLQSLSYYAKNYLFTGKISGDFFAENISVEECGKICPHFVGHILHRIVRKMNRYPDFHINFDTYKAIRIWNYWNKNRIFFPFNCIMSKGEIGINPTVPDLEYKIYTTNIIENSDEKLTFKLSATTNIKIIPQLIELSKLMMRKKYEK